MSSTHRGLNRILLGVLGLILMAIGVLTAAAALVPAAGAMWTSTTTAAWNSVLKTFRNAPVGTLDFSWWTLAVLAVLIIGIVLAFCWIFSQGGGRSARIGTAEAGGTASAGSQDTPGSTTVHGTTTVESSVAGHGIRAALKTDDRILSTSVSAWNVRGTDALRLGIQTRKGSSPKEIADLAEEAVHGLDELLGVAVPVLIRIHSGLRSRFAGAGRVR